MVVRSISVPVRSARRRSAQSYYLRSLRHQESSCGPRCRCSASRHADRSDRTAPSTQCSFGRARTYMYRCHRVDAQEIAGRIAGGRAAVRAIRSNTSCSARSNPSPGLAHHAAGAKMPAAHSCPWSIQAVRSLLDAHLFDRTQYKGDTNGLGQYIDLAFERRANLRAGGFIEGIVVARDHGIGPFDVVGRIHNRNDIVTPRRAPQSRVTLVGHEPRQPREQPCIVAKLAHLDLRNVSALLTSRKPELTPAEHRSARNSSHSLLDELSDPNSIALKQCENSFRRLADLGSIEPLQ